MKDTIRRGSVDWTGDNPFVYLKRDPGGDWSCLALFFRIVASPFGRGNAILCLENPYQADEPGARLGLTDNLPLSKYLVENFVKKFGLFRPAHAALDRVTWMDNAEFYTHAQDDTGLTEGGRAGDRSLSLTWAGLQSPFMVDVPPAKSQTGEHVMFSVFQAASAGSIAVDGRNIEGSTVERDFFGSTAQSAALAHSETWLRPE